MAGVRPGSLHHRCHLARRCGLPEQVVAMARNPAAQTAFGPTVLAAVEQNEPPDRRLVDDDLAGLFLPAPLRGLVAATRVAPIRRLMIRGSEFTGPGLWVNMACRKHFIDDKLAEALDTIDAVVILGAGFDTRPY